MQFSFQNLSLFSLAAAVFFSLSATALPPSSTNPSLGLHARNLLNPSYHSIYKRAFLKSLANKITGKKPSSKPTPDRRENETMAHLVHKMDNSGRVTKHHNDQIAHHTHELHQLQNHPNLASYANSHDAHARTHRETAGRISRFEMNTPLRAARKEALEKARKHEGIAREARAAGSREELMEHHQKQIDYHTTTRDMMPDKERDAILQFAALKVGH